MTSTEKFKHSLVVIDTETTHLLPELAEVVEVASASWTKDGWKTRGSLFGAVNGIPPAASAKNNISNKMIAGLPTFAQSIDAVCDIIGYPDTQYYVAHNANYDQTVLAHACDRVVFNELKQICEDKSRWICTWRLSKHILKHDFDDMEYGLNFLRYKLDLPVKDDLQLHRATDDAYLCAVLLDYLIAHAIKNHLIDPEDNICEQLNELCWKPIIQSHWPFGKYKGKDLTEIPNDYYAWAFKNIPGLNEDSKEYDSDLAESVRMVLEERLSS
jgi:DNA polymerase III epsilon subunit-like protein